MGRVASEADPGLYIKQVGSDVVYLLIYVDDILLASASHSAMQTVKVRPDVCV